LLLLPLLPDQKEDTQRRKATRPRSNAFAFATIIILTLALAYATIIDLLAIFPSTACLAIVGGEGCLSTVDVSTSAAPLAAAAATSQLQGDTLGAVSGATGDGAVALAAAASAMGAAAVGAAHEGTAAAVVGAATVAVRAAATALLPPGSGDGSS